MMKKTARILIPLLMFCACSPEGSWDKADQQIVVDGWIDSGSAPVVMVTSTVSPSSRFQTVDELQKHILKWAKVSISDEDTTVVLTGRIDNDYFPPFIFSTAYMEGVPGKSYSLKVEYSGLTVTAVTTVPRASALVSLEARPVPDSDSLFTLVAKLGQSPPERSFYRFFTKVEGEDRYFHATFPGAYDSAALKDGAEITLTKGYSMDGHKLSSHFRKEDTVYVKFCTMDEGAWQFWSDLDKICSLGKAIIFPTFENPSSNIAGGLGYWAGYGTSYYSIKL